MSVTRNNGVAGKATLTVRVPTDVLADVDLARSKRDVQIPRNTWILEALVEKLGRETKAYKEGGTDGTK